MKTAAIFASFLIIATAFAVPDIELKFSLDDGKTWSDDLPVVTLKKPEFQVKAIWKDDEKRPIMNGMASSSLVGFDGNFASANCGHQASWKPSGFYQKLNPPHGWSSLSKPKQFVYRVNLGTRPAGVMGFSNKWDPAKKYFVNGPLPAVAKPTAPGTYRFGTIIQYYIKEDKKPVQKIAEFSVIVKGE